MIIFRMVFHALIILGLGLLLLDPHIHTVARVAAGFICIVPYGIYIHHYIENLGKPITTEKQLKCEHDIVSDTDSYSKIAKTYCRKCGIIIDMKKIVED